MNSEFNIDNCIEDVKLFVLFGIPLLIVRLIKCLKY